MPKQEEHERVENLVEHPHGKPATAHTLEEAVNANNDLEGFAAMNGITDKNDEVVEYEEEQKHKK